jgi:hypothetical protein
MLRGQYVVCGRHPPGPLTGREGRDEERGTQFAVSLLPGMKWDAALTSCAHIHDLK